MYAAFEIATSKGKEALIQDGVPQKWAEAIEKIATKNIKVKETVVKAMLILKTFNPNGVDDIKNALDIKTSGVIIKYIGAPKYMVEIKGQDYLVCEKLLKETESKITASFKNSGGEIEVQRL